MIPKEIATGIMAVQHAVTSIDRTGKNRHLGNAYSTLEDIVGAIREPMHAAGLTWSQLPGSLSMDGMCIQITTVITHVESGEQFENAMFMPLSKKDAQGIGSAITYACRYSLLAILGIPSADFDDDGEASVRRSAPPPPRAQARNEQHVAFEARARECNNMDELVALAEEFGVTTADPVIMAITKETMQRFDANSRRRSAPKKEPLEKYERRLDTELPPEF